MEIDMKSAKVHTVNHYLFFSEYVNFSPLATTERLTVFCPSDQILLQKLRKGIIRTRKYHINSELERHAQHG